jgi:hypothetical protein
MSAPTFMDFVENHERDWGTELYPARPRLLEILQSPIVAFWDPSPLISHNPTRQQARLVVTLHKELIELENYFARLLLSNTAAPKQRLSRLYKGQQPVLIRGIKVIFDEPSGG